MDVLVFAFIGISILGSLIYVASSDNANSLGKEIRETTKK